MENAAAPKEAPVEIDKPKTFWDRLKVFWWARGVVSGLALVGLADHLGFVRHEWLRPIHAIGARWNDWMGLVTELINVRLPWHLKISANEASVLVFISVFPLPLALATWTRPYRGLRRPAKPQIAVAWATRMFAAVTVLLLPLSAQD